MRKIREVLRLRFGAGASVRETALSCRLSTSTVTEYGYRAEAAGYGWPLPDELDDEALERALFPPRQGQLTKIGAAEAPLEHLAYLKVVVQAAQNQHAILWTSTRT